MKRIRRLAEAQRDELAEDYYHLHSIYLSRFQQDSALYYLIKRAELDTTNAQWQLDAGNFYDKLSMNYDAALVYFQRALRYAIANEGEQSLRAAIAHNNIAYALTCLKRYDEALPEQRTALHLYTRIYGAEHEQTVARMTNMGVIYYYKKQLDSAQVYFDKAELAYSALSNRPETNVSLLHTDLLMNQAAIDVAQKQLEKAYARLLKAKEILPKEGEEKRHIKLLSSLGAVAKMRGKSDEAHSYWQQAYDLALTFYGPEHPTTQKIQKNLQ